MKIVIGLSGGLDSTYAAHLLQKQGHEVEGVFLRMHEGMDPAEARESAASLGIPFHIVDKTEAFRQAVIEPFMDEYARGHTPNPCVVCNRYVKIAALCEYAEANGFDRAATGHYGDVLTENGRYYVTAAADETRDQSYMLWQLTQAQLARLIMPLAGLHKSEIRRAAEALGMAATERPESREICFIPDDDYAGYIERARGAFPPGDFLDETGRPVGRHRGVIHYTVGQRKHLGIALGKPVYVTRIDPVENTVTVAPAGGEFVRGAVVRHLNFQKFHPEEGHFPLAVKVRYAARPAAADVTVQKEPDGSYTARLVFADPVRAVTPGQSAVFYQNGDLVFGGLIEESITDGSSD